MKHILLFLLLTAKLFAQITPESTSQQLRNTIIFPVEVFGKSGATESIYVNLDNPSLINNVAGLRLKIHGLTYTNKASVKVNNSRWYDLSNSNVVFLNPIEAAMQGMQTVYFTGPFSTFNMFLSVPKTNFYQTNTISFRFNDFNGLTIGYRLLDIGIVNSNYTDLTLKTRKTQDDPSKWKPFSTDPARINNGSNKWFSAVIKHNGVAIIATCNDCHVEEGYDLKYFNYSNKSIVLRSTALHSLSLQDAQDIASFIRTRNVPYEPDARPWNPPYQPGPGLDSKPIRSWAAGAGLDWILWNDNDVLTNIFPMGTLTNLVNYGTNGLAPYNPLLTLNAREIPTYLPFPDWNRWLPHIHPLDAFPTVFTNRNMPPFNFISTNNQWYKALVNMTNKNTQAYNILDTFYIRIGEQTWQNIGKTWPTNWNDINGGWGPYYTKEFQEYRLRSVSFFKWMNVKFFEIMHEFQLEDIGDTPGASATQGYWSNKRRWPGFARALFFTAPHTTKVSDWAKDIPNTPPYTGWMPESASWYYLAQTLNDCNRNAIDQWPTDQGYFQAFLPATLMGSWSYPGGWNLKFTNRAVGMVAFTFIKSMEWTEKSATNIPTGYWGNKDGVMGYRPWVGTVLGRILSHQFYRDYSDKPKYEALVNILIPKYCDSVARFTPAQYSVTADPIWLYNDLLGIENYLKSIVYESQNTPNFGYKYTNFTSTINKIKTTRNTMWPDKP